ncbi:MAG: aminoacyl-tRNA hydrolase [Deltaproteobacteria bacterium]|nr:aminoacyl-tRNA hydrolase [Deltaproteobacteria bacterium]
MPERRQLIVGLGNPGRSYQGTRHNVGFMVVDRLAHRHRISLNSRKFGSIFGLGKVHGLPVILAKPMAYMNLSGPAARNVANFFKLDTSDLLVIHDDVDIVFGKIKMAFGGGTFARVRVGIGRPDTGEEVRGYVLNRFDAQQEASLDKVITMAQEAVETILLKGLREGMNRFHGKTIQERNVGRRI